MIATLSSWLEWQQGLHHSSIDLGLDRVREVLRRLQFQPPSCPVITIAGTKGKGSCAAMLTTIYSAAGYRAGMFTSPHLQRYNERIQINQQEISDESLCVAFERINTARGEISLTYFEFNTLAALLAFSTATLDVWILEVGMGGRLDAVNVMDADVAIVTSIGLDHTEWLGNDLESIGREKAGIFRAHRPALYGAAQMPSSIATTAENMHATLQRANHDFGFTAQDQHWSWWMKDAVNDIHLDALPWPGIAGGIQLWNASVTLAALQLLIKRLPVSRTAIDAGLKNVFLHGRFQRVESTKTPGVEWILDVAHNPMSAMVLAEHLHDYLHAHRQGKLIAIIGMLSDKDVQGTIMALRDCVAAWIAVTLQGTRALSATQLAEHLRHCEVTVLATAEDINVACEIASQQVVAGDVILVCGSFMTVGPALTWLERSD